MNIWVCVAKPRSKEVKIFLSCWFSSRMSPSWVPWVVAFLSTVLRLDASVTQGRDSPGKNIVISFRCKAHIDMGERGLSLQVQAPVQTGSRSGFGESSFFSQKSFPSLFTTWNGPVGEGTSCPRTTDSTKGKHIACSGSLWYWWPSGELGKIEAGWT